MHLNHYARKKRQLKVLAKKIQDLSNSRLASDVADEIERLVDKLKKLYQQLVGLLTKRELRYLMGAAVLCAGLSQSNNAIAQSFLPPQENPFGLISTYENAFPAFADLDGDSDTDLLVGEYYGAMQYFENTGTASNPQFAAPQVNPFGMDSVNQNAFPVFVDLDNDGDMDLLVGEYLGNMQYFENTGTASSPQFTTSQQNPFGLTATNGFANPTFADIDNDGDFDLLVGESYGALQYFENTGTAASAQFAAAQVNPFGLDSVDNFSIPSFIDLDKDGDFDLLVGEAEGALKYFENIGTNSSAQFASPKKNPFGLISTYDFAAPAFADLDNDGDMDLLVGEYEGDLHYFENTTIPEDLSVGAVLSPISECGLSSNETVTASIVNVGTDTIFSFQANYQIDNQSAISENVVDTLAPGDTLIHTFQSAANLSVEGAYQLNVWTALAADSNL